MSGAAADPPPPHPEHGELDSLQASILAHLHANSRTGVANLAAMIGVAPELVEQAVARLEAAGHVERDGEELIPDAASHPTPGLFIATERSDARSLEVPYSEDEQPYSDEGARGS